jgi:homoserine/homoserine lactone efflux protein
VEQLSTYDVAFTAPCSTIYDVFSKVRHVTLNTWLWYLLTDTTMSLSPGPAVFYTVSRSARSGVRRALPAALGILSANAIYFALSATSLGVLIAASATFFGVVKWTGAAYLVYLGIRSLLAGKHSGAVALNAAAVPADAKELRRVYFGAITLQLANPKALLFFLALLPQFIEPKLPVVPQMLILAATSMIPEFLILIGYGWLSHRALRASTRFGVSSGMNRWLARIEGVGLFGCAALVLDVRRGA